MENSLRVHRQATQQQTITDLMSNDRAADFSISHGALHFDYSKTQIDTKARELLLTWAREQNVEARRDAMFSGEKINDTEGRAVLHTALRADAPLVVEGVDVNEGIQETHDRMCAFADDVRSGGFAGAGGKITDVINIGIGGSDLGPAMAALALAPYADGPRCHFVSNVDPVDIADALKACDPKTTLVIVASKTFTTIETMTNAACARDWMAAEIADTGAQFAALSSNLDATADWGIAQERVFGFENWVGGRYSVWGPIGLALMIAIGPQRFREFLAGAAKMDQHFKEAPLEENMPVMHALVGLWHHQICEFPTRAVLPYDQRLARLPAYLQQLEMESNGKGVARDGSPLATSGPVVWGEPGTNGQHAFYQLIHQGPETVPCEFLVAARGHEPQMHDQHRILVANCLAQSKALMTGRSLEQARAKVPEHFTGEERERQAKHRVFSGNRPSVTLAYPQLTPEMLGMLIALYEHRVFVEGVILGLNSYDQWGVELGKELATALAPVVSGEADEAEASTAALVGVLRESGL